MRNISFFGTLSLFLSGFRGGEASSRCVAVRSVDSAIANERRPCDDRQEAGLKRPTRRDRSLGRAFPTTRRVVRTFAWRVVATSHDRREVPGSDRTRGKSDVRVSSSSKKPRGEIGRKRTKKKKTKFEIQEAERNSERDNSADASNRVSVVISRNVKNFRETSGESKN